MNLIRCKKKDSVDSEVFFCLTDIAPGRLRLQLIGERLYNLSNLDELHKDDISNLMNLLRVL